MSSGIDGRLLSCQSSSHRRSRGHHASRRGPGQRVRIKPGRSWRQSATVTPQRAQNASGPMASWKRWPLRSCHSSHTLMPRFLRCRRSSVDGATGVRPTPWLCTPDRNRAMSNLWERIPCSNCTGRISHPNVPTLIRGRKCLCFQVSKGTSGMKTAWFFTYAGPGRVGIARFAPCGTPKGFRCSRRSRLARGSTARLEEGAP